jgi:GntR family transcriptional regulator
MATRLPLYVQVEDILAARISSGALPVGTQLPSEEDLIREFNVSRTTIRVTIQNLVRRGMVEIRRGRGTFVASPRIVQELTELTGFVEDMRVLGRIPTARVLSGEVVSAAPLSRRSLVSLRGQVLCGSNASAFPTACHFLSTRLICRRTSAAGS